METESAEHEANMDVAAAPAENADTSSPPTSRSMPIPKKIHMDKLSFFDLPGEIRNKIYALCKRLIVDIVKPLELQIPGTIIDTKNYGFDSLFDIHPTLTHEFSDVYYTENVFFVDARKDEFICHGLQGVRYFKHWSSQLSERHAGMIQHLQIATPAFVAEIRIPQIRDKSIDVQFHRNVSQHVGGGRAIRRAFHAVQRYMARYDPQGETMKKAKLIFWQKLEKFNAEMSGRRLGVDDLNRLVVDVIGVVPFCCFLALSQGLLCSTVADTNEGETIRACCCVPCCYEHREMSPLRSRETNRAVLLRGKKGDDWQGMPHQ